MTNKVGSINWRCKDYWKIGDFRCKVNCTTFGEDFIRPPPMQYLKNDGTIRHLPPTKEKKQIMEFVDNIKDEIPRTSQPLKHFYEKSLCKFARATVQKTTETNEEFDFVQFAIACPQFYNIRRGLGKIRRIDTPVLPKTLVAIDFDGQYITTIYLGRFLLFDTKGSDRIMTFASNYQLQILSRATRWHGDGTFKAAPELFSQVYLIHGWYLEEMHPCLFILTADHTKATYKRVLQQFKKSVAQHQYALKPLQFMSDFEQGAIGAFTEEFPSVNIKDCHFHFTQAIWRRIQELGLAAVFKENDVIRAWLEKFKSLAFVS